MSDYDPAIAEAARMTEQELFEEINRRIRDGRVVLPKDPEARKKALSLAMLQVLGDKYEAVQQKLS